MVGNLIHAFAFNLLCSSLFYKLCERHCTLWEIHSEERQIISSYYENCFDLINLLKRSGGLPTPLSGPHFENHFLYLLQDTVTNKSHLTLTKALWIGHVFKQMRNLTFREVNQCIEDHMCRFLPSDSEARAGFQITTTSTLQKLLNHLPFPR